MLAGPAAGVDDLADDPARLRQADDGGLRPASQAAS